MTDPRPPRTNEELVRAFDYLFQQTEPRTPEEVDEGTIDGSINIDFRDPDFKENIAKLDRTKPIAVYCGAGGRSGKTSELLQELGFKEIYDLSGGFSQWEAENYPVSKKNSR